MTDDLVKHTREGWKQRAVALRQALSEAETERDQALKWQQFYMAKAERLTGALETIADQTAEFKHGDANLEIFVRGLASKAKAALAPQPKEPEK